MLHEARGMGLLEFSSEEIYRIGAQQLLSLDKLLGSKDFFLGNNPTTVDATAFAFLDVILKTPLPMSIPLRAELFRLPRLVEYCSRVEKI
jgi:glutathione S-transferase